MIEFVVLAVIVIVLLYAHHMETFISDRGGGLNRGNGAHIAFYGSSGGGLFQHDANHGRDGAGALLDRLGV